MRAERPLRFPPSSVVARGRGGITHKAQTKGEGRWCDAALRQAPVQARVRALYIPAPRPARRVVSSQQVREGGVLARSLVTRVPTEWKLPLSRQSTRLERRASSRNA